MNDRSTLLLEHHLKELKLPSFLRPATGSTARSASSSVTTPSRLGSPSSAKITGVGNSCPSSLMTVLPISTGALLPSASSDWAERSTGTPSLRSSSLGTAVKVEPVSTVTSRSSNICPCGSPTAMVTFTVPTAFLLSLSLLVACCQDGLVGVPRRLQFCGSCGVRPFPGSPVALRVRGG